MKFILSLIALVALLSTAAIAETCEQRAENCVTRGGKRAVCFGASVMAKCRKTCAYVAPYSGKSWPATDGCKKG